MSWCSQSGGQALILAAVVAGDLPDPLLSLEEFDAFLNQLVECRIVLILIRDFLSFNVDY